MTECLYAIKPATEISQPAITACLLKPDCWVARTGSPWRDLPNSYSHWNRVYVLYDRWSRKDGSQKLMASLAGETAWKPNGGWPRPSAFIPWCHKKTAQTAEAVVRSRGGLSTKIYATADAALAISARASLGI